MSTRLRILGTGRYEPGLCVDSSSYDQRFGLEPGSIERATGVRTRRFVDRAAGETASMMAEQAARRALQQAGIAPDQLCAILGACGVMEQPIPATAVLVHRRLGLGESGIPAFDVNATCLSFLCALELAALRIAAGSWQRVLVFSSDVASAALDAGDPDTAALFGDGAAAVVLGADDSGSALLSWALETYSCGAETSWLGAGGSRLPLDDMEAFLAEATFRMDGARAYRIAARYMPGFLDRLLDGAGLQLADIDLVVPHQASGHALELMKTRLDLHDGRVVELLAEHGNQIATSLPHTLAWAIEHGRVKRGDKLLLLGTGAGVSIGGAVLVY